MCAVNAQCAIPHRSIAAVSATSVCVVNASSAASNRSVAAVRVHLCAWWQHLSVQWKQSVEIHRENNFDYLLHPSVFQSILGAGNWFSVWLFANNTLTCMFWDAGWQREIDWVMWCSDEHVLWCRSAQEDIETVMGRFDILMHMCHYAGWQREGKGWCFWGRC